MSIVRCHPARELNSFDEDLNRLFRGFWGREPHWNVAPTAYLPPVDVEETRDQYRVSVELPGLTQADVKVTVVDDALVIRGEKKDTREEKDVNHHRVERTYGSFERALQLGTRVDRNKIRATMKDGVLRVEVPKMEEAREREISVEVN